MEDRRGFFVSLLCIIFIYYEPLRTEPKRFAAHVVCVCTTSLPRLVTRLDTSCGLETCTCPEILIVPIIQSMRYYCTVNASSPEVSLVSHSSYCIPYVLFVDVVHMYYSCTVKPCRWYAYDTSPKKQCRHRRYNVPIADQERRTLNRKDDGRNIKIYNITGCISVCTLLSVYLLLLLYDRWLGSRKNDCIHL